MVLSVVLPAYNEQSTIEEVVLEHHRVLGSLGSRFSDWEIVCLDDASSDATPAILKKLAASVPKLRVLTHSSNQGIYASFHDLFASARGTHIYLTASDGQWPAANLVTMLAALEAGADLVVGVRLNRSEIYSASRRAISFLFNLLPRIFFGVKTSDAGSIKLGVRDVFRFDLISRSPFVEAERIIHARRRGFRVAFVPIEFLSRTAGKERGASWLNIRRSLIDCFRCVGFYGWRMGSHRRVAG